MHHIPDKYIKLLSSTVTHIYFDPSFYRDEDSESSSASQKLNEDKKRNYIEKAWEVFKVGVFYKSLGPFQYLFDSKDSW